MELKYLHFKSAKNTKIYLSKIDITDGTKGIIIHVRKIVPREGYIPNKQYHIIRTFSKCLLVEVYIALKSTTFSTIMLFNHCQTIEELESFTNSTGEYGTLEVGIKLKT